MGRRPRSGQGQRSQPVLRAMSVVLSCVLPCHFPWLTAARGTIAIRLCVKNSVSVCLDTHTPDRSV